MSSPSSLRPAWHRGSSGGGRGFQPPPTVASSRPKSVGEKKKNFNKFSALDDDEDVATMEKKAEETARRLAGGNSRSEGLRSARPSNKGRSLADLAARAPDRERSGSYGSAGDRHANGHHHHVEENVIRYTREKLLSMRPSPASEPPNELVERLGADSCVMNEVAQDPVCWDDLDADAIWTTVARERRASSKVEGQADGRRNSKRDSRHNRWERGVALPTQDQKKGDKAENPTDLWDDPQATDAAADFSAFGAMPEDDAFDFEKMAAATQKMDQDLCGGRSRASSLASADDVDALQSAKVDPKRPLASIGTTIRSGNVNVFEDFADPAAEVKPDQSEVGVHSGNEIENASSKLMAMIGVSKEPEPQNPEGWNAGGKVDDLSVNVSIPLNPWGGPLLPGQDSSVAFLGGASATAEMEQKAREEEQRRIRQQQEAQRQAVERSRQAQLQQNAGLQNQVELVLMERISSFLEKSWGQADLPTILSSLQAEDPRVIGLLDSIEALKALIIRNPHRIALKPNPLFGSDMAVVVMTNAQWQQQEAAKQAQARSQQQVLHRQEQQQRALNEQASLSKSIRPGAPWYYSDPQQNIQGPFSGEEMRQWLEAGYFKSDLPICQDQTGPFRPLLSWFPDPSVAFVQTETEKAREEAEKKAQQAQLVAQQIARAEKEAAEQARRVAEAAETERMRLEAAKKQEAAERESQQPAQTQKSSHGDVSNESSSKLKMMLGMGGSADERTQAAVNARSSSKNESTRKAEAPSAPTAEESETATPVPAKAAVPAWGGASQPTSRKSMSEIQNEEARKAALAARQGGGRKQSSGWANIAASKGSNGWSGNIPQQRPAMVLKKQVAPIHTVKPSRGVTSTSAVGSVSAVPKTATSANSDEFGANIPPALATWCKDQLMKLNGSDDLTLVSFCMTLTHADEIRQYITAYLGSSPQVNSFATEFINRKNGKTQQEQWETTATAKKGRKKKAR